MRLPATQQLTDGELFYIIENGIRLTAMPAWGDDAMAGAISWKPCISSVIYRSWRTRESGNAEAQPESSAGVKEELEDERFFKGRRQS